MLQAINQGLVLNAIVEAGFNSTYDHFDIVRFAQADDAGNILRLDVTCELPFKEPEASSMAAYVREKGLTHVDHCDLAALPPQLAQLARSLLAVGCVMRLPGEEFADGKFPGGAVALFERTDELPRRHHSPSHLRFHRAKVRAYY